MIRYFFLLVLATLPAQASLFGNLHPNANYMLWIDAEGTSVITSNQGSLSFNLPSGSHTVKLELISINPTQEPTPVITSTPVPTNTPTASPTATRTKTRKGREVVVGSYSAVESSNRYEVIDTEGNSLTGTIQVLSGANSEAQMDTLDINADGLEEVVASGLVAGKGVVVECWNGWGEMVQSQVLFSEEFSAENHLLADYVLADGGKAAVVVGRDANGAYHMNSTSLDGGNKGSSQILGSGYDKLESVKAIDTDGNGSSEVVMLARKSNKAVELNVVKDFNLMTSVILFGNGYPGNAYVFGLDINGDGVKEIGAVSRSSTSQSFRLVVVSENGEVVLKRNMFPGQFEDQGTFKAEDIDADGKDEIVAIARMTSGVNVLQVIDDNGDQLIARSILDANFVPTNSVVTTDVNGDGQEEFVVAGHDSISGSAVYQVIEKSGQLVGGGVVFDSPATPALGSSDIDQDGTDELLIMGEFSEGAYGLQILSGVDGQVQFSTLFTSAPSLFDGGDVL